MKIYHLDCGSMCPAMGRIYKNYFLPDTVCHCFLIETSDRLLLVDTGIGKQDMRDPKRLGLMGPLLGVAKSDGSTSAHDQVAALGYSPGDVTDIFATHLDLDHAGGIPDFPGARIHVHERELEAATKRDTFVFKQRYKDIHIVKDAKWETFKTGSETWHGFDRAQEFGGFGSDLLAIALPGHTPGHVGVAVREGDGWLLHAGDSYYNRREISREDKLPFGMQTFRNLVHNDVAEAKRTQVKLREIAKDSSIKMVSSHDPAEFRSSAKRNPSKT